MFLAMAGAIFERQFLAAQSLFGLAIDFFPPLYLNKNIFSRRRQIFLFTNNKTTLAKRQTRLRDQKKFSVDKIKIDSNP